MVVGYKNWLGDNESINGVSKRYYLNNLTQTFDESHGNELTVRLIYFLDYNQLGVKNDQLTFIRQSSTIANTTSVFFGYTEASPVTLQKARKCKCSLVK